MKSKKKNVELVVLVNSSGKKTGIAEKMEVHEKGWLHRAFSIFIFNSKGEMLLQQRADTKYHFGGLWTNACCSHPRPGEKITAAAKRRLMEELGISTKLSMLHSIQYCFHDSKSGLTEHEFDYILTGNYNDAIKMNPDEVKSVKWLSMTALSTELSRYPQKFTPWFKLIMRQKPLAEK
ncbi:MAG: isopentenyl-diphosphate Delta-isomerase [Chitinophagales bacterium]